MSSTAISQSTVAAVTGIDLKKGNFSKSSPFLPQTISIFAEANTDFQSGLSTEPLQITNARAAAEAYGYGSPMHRIAQTLFPKSGGGVSVPVYCYAQEEAGSAAAKKITITPSGNATASGTVYVRVAGRNVSDTGTYAVNIASGDTPTEQCDKFRAAVAAIRESPITGSGTSTFIAEAKWKGLTSNDLKVIIDTDGNDIGVTYSVAVTTAGSGTPSVSASLALIGNVWKTLIINSYGLVSATITEFETFNGVPGPTPTGRFDATIWKPIYVLSGTLLDDPTSITDAAARKSQLTIWTCPAPLSQGFGFEAAANVAVVLSKIFQDTPNISPLNQVYPDMPGPVEGAVPAMVDFATRDAYVKKGCSTVDFVNGRYVMKDFVSTYHPDGENPPHYRYPVDINKIANMKYRYALREQEVLIGKQLANNEDAVTAANVITPNGWKTEVFEIIDSGVADGLIVDADFSKASTITGINNVNPNRMDTEFSIKTSGVAYQSSTTMTQGFNFGS